MFDELIDYFPPELELHFYELLKREDIIEIRLRKCREIIVKTVSGFYFITKDNALSKTAENALICSKNQFDAVFKRICDYSVYSHISSAVNGYITIIGGHRVGISSSAVTEQGKIISIKEPSSLNFRFARQIFGTADSLYKKLHNCSFVIFGVPCSGKTTLLRDYTRLLANDLNNVSIIDERGEISSVVNGVPRFDLGHNSDVLVYPKSKGAEIAVRTMSPDFIAFDETGADESKILLNSAVYGVNFITTAHALNLNQLLMRNGFKELFEKNVFDYAVELSSKNIGKIKRIYSAYEINEYISGFGNNSNFGFSGNEVFREV